jgi:hypothetical protein
VCQRFVRAHITEDGDGVDRFDVGLAPVDHRSQMTVDRRVPRFEPDGEPVPKTLARPSTVTLPATPVSSRTLGTDRAWVVPAGMARRHRSGLPGGS